jgi:hypothetical protein
MFFVFFVTKNVCLTPLTASVNPKHRYICTLFSMTSLLYLSVASCQTVQHFDHERNKLWVLSSLMYFA